MRESLAFYSYKPYLYVVLHRERGISVTFSKECTHITSNPIEIQLLREYAEKTKSSYLIVEAGGDLGKEELARLHQSIEDKQVAEAEKGIAEQGLADEKKKAEHDFYSMLRFTDSAYR